MQQIISMKTFSKIGILFLILVYFMGSTGVSFYRHICISSGTSSMIVYPGLFKSPGSCCCSKPNTARWPASIEVASCCKSLSTLIRFNSGYVPSGATLIPISQPWVQSEHSAELKTKCLQPEFNPLRYFEFYSPPYYGKRLIHFLHQIKIPAQPFLA